MKPVSEAYPSGYSNKIVLRSDSTFTKTINTGSNTYTESGTYKLAKIDGKTFIAMKYSNSDVLTNNVIQSCTNSEALEWNLKDTLSNIFWSPCDGADLKFARKKIATFLSGKNQSDSAGFFHGKGCVSTFEACRRADIL